MRALLVAFLLAAVPALSGCTEPLPDLGEAPAYSIIMIDGPTVELADLEGDVVLLNLWATWCQPCKRELPLIEELHQEFQGEGLHVVAVSMDDAPDSEQAVRDYIAEYGYTFDVAWDEGAGDFIPAFYPYGTLGTPPETYLIGKDGRIVHFWQGAFDPREPENRDLVERALAA